MAEAGVATMAETEVRLMVLVLMVLLRRLVAVSRDDAAPLPTFAVATTEEGNRQDSTIVPSASLQNTFQLDPKAIKNNQNNQNNQHL